MEEIFKLRQGCQWVFAGHIPESEARAKVLEFLASVSDKRGDSDIGDFWHLWSKQLPNVDVPPESVNLIVSHEQEDGMVPVSVLHDLQWVKTVLHGDPQE